MGGILVVEEEAEVTVAPGGLGGLDPGGEDEGPYDLVFQECNAVGAAEGGAVFGDAEKFKDLVALYGGEFPLAVVGGLPGTGVLGEILPVDEWDFLLIGKEDGCQGSEDTKGAHW